MKPDRENLAVRGPMTRAQMLYVDPVSTLPSRTLLTPAQRLTEWRKQGVYRMATPAEIAAYTPERVAALLKAARVIRSVSTPWEFDSGLRLETYQNSWSSP